MSEPVIQARDLGKRYKTGWFKEPFDALRGLSFEVHPGRIYGLLGPNGAGKTTAIKILLGLTRPTLGTATLLGKPIGEPQTRRYVGYLAENQQFPLHLTARQVLDTFGGLSGLSGRERREREAAALHEVGLTGWENGRVGTFSKGMKQRLGLASALFHAPRLVILDEPTDGVDPEGRHAIRDIIKRRRDQGVTFLVNSHILQEVELIADEVTILNRGQVIQQGSVRSLTVAQQDYDVALATAEGLASCPVHSLLRPSADPRVFRFNAEKPETIDQVIDGLRAAGIGIRGLYPCKKSLEDAFLDIVRSHKEAV